MAYSLEKELKKIGSKRAELIRWYDAMAKELASKAAEGEKYVQITLLREEVPMLRDACIEYAEESSSSNLCQSTHRHGLPPVLNLR